MAWTAIFIVLSLAGTASAQTATQTPANGLFVNWTTNTYVPALYAGKRLPTSGSKIDAWATLFNKGKVIDVSNYTISWYADDRLLQWGKGVQKISFDAPARTGQIMNLRVQAQNADGNLFRGGVQVPVIAPKLAIAGDYPGGIANSFPLEVTALPYFFNVADPSALAFAWSANGQSASSAASPDRATIAVANPTSGMNIRIGLTATNPVDSTAATARMAVTYQKL